MQCPHGFCGCVATTGLVPTCEMMATGAGATSPTSGIGLVQDKPGRAMSMVNSAVLEESAQGRDDMQDGEEIHFEPDQQTPIFQVGVTL